MADRIRMTRLLLAAGIALTAVPAAAPAFAQEGMLFQNLMQGVLGNNRDDIDYRQRPTLVVPPNSTLPRPQEPGATRNAAWPDDPDVARRRDAGNAARTRGTENPHYRNNPMLSQEELRRGRTTRNTGAPVVAEEHNNYNNQIGPIRVGREMAARQGATDTSNLAYGQEPERRTLTEPPAGYRVPASTAPLGAGARGPVEDKQAVGQREFLTGRVPMTQ